MTDLLAYTAELVNIPSVSHGEAVIADHLEHRLRGVPWLDVERSGNTVVARTALARGQRLVLAGHIDTVPANGNERARIDGDVLHGLGSCDMKSGVAVLTELACTVAEPAVDVTYVLYECEEVGSEFNGINRLFTERPVLLA
jgi:succinyl-diaminopimelate desuccinylase